MACLRPLKKGRNCGELDGKWLCSVMTVVECRNFSAAHCPSVLWCCQLLLLPMRICVWSVAALASIPRSEWLPASSGVAVVRAALLKPRITSDTRSLSLYTHVVQWKGVTWPYPDGDYLLQNYLQCVGRGVKLDSPTYYQASKAPVLHLLFCSVFVCMRKIPPSLIEVRS